VADAIAINVRQAAERLGLGYVKTYELVMGGELRSIRVGSRRLIPVTALTEFVAQRLEAERADR
jgi:excisionase family DNA binding protein